MTWFPCLWCSTHFQYDTVDLDFRSGKTVKGTHSVCEAALPNAEWGFGLSCWTTHWQETTRPWWQHIVNCDNRLSISEHCVKHNIVFIVFSWSACPDVAMDCVLFQNSPDPMLLICSWQHDSLSGSATWGREGHTHSQRFSVYQSFHIIPCGKRPTSEI